MNFVKTKNTIFQTLPRLSLIFSTRSTSYNFKKKFNSPAAARDREENYRENLKNELSLATDFCSKQWDEFAGKLIRNELKLAKTYVNEKNVDGVILRLCTEFGLLNIGQNYYQHILKKHGELNEGMLSRYLALCALDQKYTLEHESEIISIYKQLRKSQVVEPLVAERCISAICNFEKHWKDAFFLLEQVKLVSSPTPSSYCTIVTACFNFGEITEGWQILKTMMNVGDYKPKPSVYVAYINHCTRLKQDGKLQLQDLEDLFQFLEDFHLNIPDLSAVDSLEKLIFSLSNDKFEWSLKETFVSRNAHCCNCKSLLEPVQISSSQFQELSKLFVKNVMVGSNVFLKTTPAELNNFKSYLNQCQPYDIVIDGLNCAYARGNKDKKILAHVLKSVVDHFVRKNKRILVLGRHHMKFWPSETMNYIFHNSFVFLASNLSQDDPLLLYAALKGGEKTFFVSRDFMRSHLFALDDPHMKLLFRKWLISHQYVVGSFTKYGSPNIIPPLQYRPTAQKLPLKEPELCWHLPYDDEYQMLPPDRKEPPPKWLCIRRLPRNR